MLLRHAIRSATFQRPLLSTRRTIFYEAVQTLSNAYLDLAIALPYPPTWPAYSSTIILVGVASRVVLFPIFLWVRARERRAQKFVIPYLRAYRLRLEERARREIALANSEAARNHFQNIVKEKLRGKRDELFKEHRCTPWITMLAPPAVQIPIYITISTVFFHAAREPGTVLRDEAFLTLSSLAQPDPTVTLPILLGLVSLASIETSGWFATEERRRKLTPKTQRGDTRRGQGQIIIKPSQYLKSTLRGLSVGRIVLAAMAPGSIEVYWLTSASFGLFQNWAINWYDHRLEATKGAQRSILGKESIDMSHRASRNLRN